MTTTSTFNALSEELPKLVSRPTSNSTSNTRSTREASISEGWEPWPEFQYQCFSDVFPDQMALPYRGPPLPRALPTDCEVSSEDTVSAAYYYYILPRVNAALDAQGGDDKIHVGPGSRHSLSADWDIARNGQILCVGDSKIDRKFHPDMVKMARDLRRLDPKRADRIQDEWEKVVGQIVGYQLGEGTRYGYCCTDGGLVVLRINSIPITDSSIRSQFRFSRPDYATHQRGLSDITDITATSAGSGETGTSEFDPEEDMHKHGIPQYAFIPWDAHGPGKLCVASGLHLLALLAGNGENLGRLPLVQAPRAGCRNARASRNLG